MPVIEILLQKHLGLVGGVAHRHVVRVARERASDPRDQARPHADGIPGERHDLEVADGGTAEAEERTGRQRDRDRLRVQWRLEAGGTAPWRAAACSPRSRTG